MYILLAIRMRIDLQTKQSGYRETKVLQRERKPYDPQSTILHYKTRKRY